MTSRDLNKSIQLELFSDLRDGTKYSSEFCDYYRSDSCVFCFYHISFYHIHITFYIIGSEHIPAFSIFWIGLCIGGGIDIYIYSGIVYFQASLECERFQNELKIDGFVSLCREILIRFVELHFPTLVEEPQVGSPM